MKNILFCSGAALLFSGCATIFQGTQDRVVFESMPTGATVTATRITENDESPISCRTPCSMKLSRKRDFRVTFELDGHKTGEAKLSSKLEGGGAAGFVGNIVFGGGVGAIVDAGTGATHDLFPNPMIAELVVLADAGESVVRGVAGKGRADKAPPPLADSEEIQARDAASDAGSGDVGSGDAGSGDVSAEHAEAPHADPTDGE